MEKLKIFNPLTLGCQFLFWWQILEFRLQRFPTRVQKKNIVSPIVGLGDSL
jgi:hypothetical protein